MDPRAATALLRASISASTDTVRLLGGDELSVQLLVPPLLAAVLGCGASALLHGGGGRVLFESGAPRTRAESAPTSGRRYAVDPLAILSRRRASVVGSSCRRARSESAELPPPPPDGGLSSDATAARPRRAAASLQATREH